MTLTRKTDVLRENPVPVPNITSTGPRWRPGFRSNSSATNRWGMARPSLLQTLSDLDDYIERFRSCLPAGRIAQSVWHSLRAGRSGDRIPVGVRFSAPVQTGPGAQPASCTMGTGSFPGVKRQGVSPNTHPPLAPRLKKEHSYTSTSPGPSWCVQGWILPLHYLYFLSPTGQNGLPLEILVWMLT